MSRSEHTNLTRSLDGRLHMICPRCRKERDILAFTPMELIEEFADQCTPLYKCPKCSWIFAPASEDGS